MSIQFEVLPSEIIHRVIYWLSDGRISANVVHPENPIPSHVYVQNSIECGDCYADLLSLSSTCTSLRRVVGEVIFQKMSLVRLNQVDSILCNPASQELYSDKRAYQRQFFIELVGRNVSNCRVGEPAAKKVKSPADESEEPRARKSRYEKELCMCYFVRFLECDNDILKNGDLKIFPNLTDLKILDQRLSSAIPESGSSLTKIKYLATHAQTLSLSPALLDTVPSLKRLDLFLDFSNDFLSNGGTRNIINKFEAGPNQLEDLFLILDNPYTIKYLETISLLRAIAKNAKLKKLMIRSKRRKIVSSLNQNQSSLNPGFSGDEILEMFGDLSSFTVDIRVLDMLNFDPSTLALRLESAEKKPLQERRHFAIVDRAIVGPHMSQSLRESLSAVIRLGQYTSFGFQYGESLEESHLHVLKIVTDFVQWMINQGQVGYCGLRSISIEKCWSVSDDSVIREYLMSSDGKERAKAKKATLWGRYPFNSPRFRVTDAYAIHYTKETGSSISDANGYFIGVSDRPYNKANFTTSPEHSKNLDQFWSYEASLCDFEQYSVPQRTSLLIN
ncbi:uncharacterized protein LODBEIA_P33150 [Lodderomyces beijingensis]|uniref:F-box domain-containing protein n=1 Tax=Lodderomyces beijingensis TaxID=1775926 RepID=A0ABP0ZQ78_9ASCO